MLKQSPGNVLHNLLYMKHARTYTVISFQQTVHGGEGTITRPRSMSSSDEDDKFLYGSDSEGREPKRLKADRPQEKDESQGGGGDDDDKEEIVSSGDDSGSSESESDSDSDVQFVISTGTNDTSRLDSTNIGGGSGITIATEPAVTDTATTSATAPLQVETTLDTATAAATNGDTTGKESSTLDLNADGLYQDEPIFNIDPEVLKEKPWRQPGANLSDYFNYGFNEYTWMEYLHRQDKLRQEYNPHKILMGLLTLQQQGKLNNPNPTAKIDTLSHSATPLPSMGNQPANNTNTTNQPNNAMPGFPPLPMFGGFPPFGMLPPGMNQFPPKK